MSNKVGGGGELLFIYHTVSHYVSVFHNSVQTVSELFKPQFNCNQLSHLKRWSVISFQDTK